MAKRIFEDCFAQLRGSCPRCVAVCFWRNNLSLSDFQRDGDGALVYEGKGEYKGLFVRMRLRVRRERLMELLAGGETGPVRFIGNEKHMGICLRMNRKGFPGIMAGEVNGITYSFDMEGSYRELSFVEDAAENGYREQGKESKNYGKETKE